MASLAEIKAMISKIEEEHGDMDIIVGEMKTEGGHLNNFGDDFVMLCRKYGKKQSVVARAIGVTPTSINKRYQRPLTKKSFFYPVEE